MANFQCTQGEKISKGRNNTFWANIHPPEAKISDNRGKSLFISACEEEYKEIQRGKGKEVRWSKGKRLLLTEVITILFPKSGARIRSVNVHPCDVKPDYVQLTGVIPGKLPDDERLVPGGGQDHLGVLGVGRDLGNPSREQLVNSHH